MVIHHLFHNMMSVQVTTCLQEHVGVVVGLCICVSVLREGDLCCLLSICSLESLDPPNSDLDSDSDSVVYCHCCIVK